MNAITDLWHSAAVIALNNFVFKTGLADRLHLWPDKSPGSQAAVKHLSTTTGLSRDQLRQWLHRCWNRISEWPSRSAPRAGH